MNDEDLTPLDVAVLTNNVPMAKMLMQHGARENPKCKSSRNLFTLLKFLLPGASGVARLLPNAASIGCTLKYGQLAISFAVSQWEKTTCSKVGYTLSVSAVGNRWVPVNPKRKCQGKFF